MNRAWMSNRVRMIDERHRVLIVVGCCILSFLATALTLSENVKATNHGGWITADETWYKAGNPHIIVKDVRVMPSVTVTILQGVNISFNLGTTLYVDGDLLVQGSGSEPVRFSSSSFIPQRGDWGSIHFNSSSGGGQPSSTIDDAIIEYGSSGVYVYNRSLNIRDCTIKENLIGIDSNLGALSVEASSIYDNTYDGINWTGWNSMSSLASISSNNITNNGGNGINGSAGAIVAIDGNDISFNTYGIRFNDSTPATFQNNIFNNSEDGIYFLRSGNGTAISNNTIANNSKNGIWVSTSSVKIDNNTMEDNGLNGTYGIYYSGTMENNTAISNPGSGIYLESSSGALLQYNNVTLNAIHGVYSHSSSLTLRKNNITRNSPFGVLYPVMAGICVEHGSTIQIDENRIENNSQRGIYAYNVTQAVITKNAISDNYYGVFTYDTRVGIAWNSMVDNLLHVHLNTWLQPSSMENSTIENNTFVGESTSRAVSVENAVSSTIISNNSIKNMNDGICLRNSSAKVYNNQIQNIYNIGIYMDGDSHEDIFNNTLQADTGIRLYVNSTSSGSPQIRNNTITQGYHGIYVAGLGTATPTIEYNDINNHTKGIRVEYSNAHPQITNNSIVDNQYGFFIQAGANATIHGCNIFDNFPYGGYNGDDSIEVNATENWWGDATGPFDDSPLEPDYNPNGAGDEVTDYIRYRWIEYGLSWLTSPAQW